MIVSIAINVLQVVESADEWKWVERLMPPKSIPLPPKHEKYPTPSGWTPPAGYYVHFIDLNVPNECFMLL